MRKLLLLCALLYACCGTSYGQSRTITGTVSDQTGHPLEAVTVTVLETQKSALTDSKGKFSIAAQNGQNLKFSYIGAQPGSLLVTAETRSANITLDMVSNNLNEVVVTGYQQERKKDLTGAVTVVNVKDIRDIPAGNAIKALQGRVPGVTISTDGSPAGNVAVRIRGIGTLNNTDPLYVIDGVPTTRGLQELNQEDIESIQVLKDAASASIYGSRAANGVIIVTTKKGKTGANRINFSATTSLQFYGSKLNVLNTQQRGEAYWRAAVNDGSNPNNNSTYQYDWNGNYNNPVLNKVLLPEYLDAARTLKPADTHWFDEISRTSVLQSYNLTVSNGSEKGNSLFSLGYYDNQGIIKESRDQKITVRFNSDYNFFNNRLKIGENFNATYMRDVLLPTTDITSLALIDEPATPVYDINGGWGGPSNGMADRQNPLRLIEDNKQNKNNFGKVFGNAFADLAVLPNLHFRSNFGVDYAINYARTIRKSYVSGFLNDPSNLVNTSGTYDGSLTWQNTLTYNLNFKKSKLDFLLGHEQIKVVNQNFSGSRQGYAIENYDYAYLNAGTTNVLNSGGGAGNSLLSFFGKANYVFNDRYLASVTLRRDGSSQFGINNRYGYFPAASLGWRLSEESFFKNKISFVSDLKLRYSWGQTGNQSAPNYATNTLYAPIYGTNITGLFDGGTAYDIGGSGTGQLPSGYVQTQQGNANLKWETATQNNFGLDYGMFNNSLTGSFDYFIKNTTDILITPAYLAVIGEGGNQTANGASVKNTGFEAMVNYNTNLGRDLSINISANISAYRNKVTKLPEAVLTSYPGNGTDKNILGRSVNSIFGYVANGLFTTQAEVDNSPVQPGKGLGRIRYKDLNGDGVVDNKDQDYIGSFDPDFSYGFNAGVKYKDFDLTFFLQGVQGNSVYNTYKVLTDFTSLQPGANWGSRVLQAWTPQNPNSTIPALTTVDRNNEGRGSTYFVENGSYLKLRNIQLGYDLKKALKGLKIRDARVFIQASNLLTIKSSSYSATDPENAVNNFPIPIVTTLGVNVTF
ncbi:SusC/RagA family TonB-linked outer membrane protein [Mucilaginibacter polytrichastri]|uniref:SusC/RagA family TonB-linked outer membrane protein n=1 Tax=Mucilaginibacter polytrichastri TaxID=1302689 RepID=UPI0008EDAD60|nr:TonB-dependent receptor [Mucilaginibacter polytrichastri]SFT23725.1 TonB-linked outer membrane protein, SusC/RagA family [Mucilaginibacter polytrichastri]